MWMDFQLAILSLFSHIWCKLQKVFFFSGPCSCPVSPSDPPAFLVWDSIQHQKLKCWLLTAGCCSVTNPMHTLIHSKYEASRSFFLLSGKLPWAISDLQLGKNVQLVASVTPAGQITCRLLCAQLWQTWKKNWSGMNDLGVGCSMFYLNAFVFHRKTAFFLCFRDWQGAGIRGERA